MELSKDLVGTTIYGIPTGNNARHNSRIADFEVTKVGRKYFTLRRIGFNVEGAYCPVTGSTQAAINSGYVGNAGYKFFRTMEELEEYQTNQLLVKEVGSLMRDMAYGRRLENVSRADLQTIKGILENA